MIELAITDETPEQPPATGLSETDILDCFNDSSILEGQRNYLLAVGRAIEAKVQAQQTLLVQCHLSGQMSASQSVGHFGKACSCAALPKADLLRAAAYLAADDQSPDCESSIDAAEADRIAAVLRGLAA